MKHLQAAISRGVAALGGWLVVTTVIVITCGIVILPLWYAADRYPQQYTQISLAVIGVIAGLLLLWKAIKSILRRGIRAWLGVLLRSSAGLLCIAGAVVLAAQRTIWGYIGAGCAILALLALAVTKKRERAQ